MIRPSLPAASALAALLLSASNASAQQPAVVIGRPVSPIVLQGSGSIPPEVLEELMAEGIDFPGAVSMDMASSGDSEESEKEPIDPQLMQMLQQAILDRRPSNILSEWSKPEPLPGDEDPELADPEEPEALDDAPEAPTEPKAPEKPSDLVEPKRPEDVTADVRSLSDLLGLAEEKRAAAESYLEAKEAYDAKLAEHESAVGAFEAEKATYDEAKAAYDIEKEAWDAKKKAYDKAKKEYDKKVAENKTKRVQRTVDLFRRDVALGRWDGVAEILDLFDEKQAKQQYAQILGKISRSPQPMNGPLARYQEEPAFEFDDIVDIVRIAPGCFENDKANLVAPLVRRVLAQGHSLDDWVERLQAEIARPEEERVISQRLAALLLTAQRSNLELGEFLPPFDELVEGDDREGLNLLARHHLARYDETPAPATLAEAWDATLAVLAPGEIEDKQKKEALKRAVDLASRVRDELGDAWLRETFTERPERGMEVLAVIGAEASRGMTSASKNTENRLQDLQLLKGAVDALLEIAPERAQDWGGTLTLVADTWLREARHSFENSESKSLGSSYQRDRYGNIFFDDYSYYRRSRGPQVTPIQPGDLLEIRPGGAWRDSLPESLRPKIDQTIAELYLKVQEEALAFPYIKELAPANPKKANELAETFINVWLSNNDPNNERNRTSIYNFSYGFNQRASGIPLTRSRQERNLRDLAKWIGELRGVEGIELDSQLLMRAFTQVHSQAEVYRVENLETVFGDLDSLEPDTLASMTQKMRANLATLWRIPDVQRDAKTNRKQKEIEAEVQRGYQVAQALLARALEAHPDNWRLMVARGAMLHDLNNYRNEIKKNSDFSGDRRTALDVLQQAALAYVEGIDDLRADEYSVDAFSTWFYASLGASDLGAVDQKTLLATGEIPAIKAMLDGLEGEAGDEHRAMFANQVFTRLSSVNPAVKTRYLRTGFNIVGDHPQAREAKKVYDYYEDLITEIELVASVDGTTDVGTDPFGVFIDLRYTKEIGRESGGFGKYLQNQANAVSYYYNFGRPQENYRDKFEESVRTLLEERFEVLSVTFNRENAATKMDPGPSALKGGGAFGAALSGFMNTAKAMSGGADSGWRRTSYAYLLLKAKGPEVDRIPPLKLDLDFNDVTGYVVLPVTSAVVPIDAAEAQDERPFGSLAVTQILDERRADEGVLGLEIKAQAEGLLPDLDDILEVDPERFDVANVDVQDLSVERFADSEDAVVSQRLWTLELRPKEGAGKPKMFKFPKAKSDEAEVLFQRYDDADLMEATPVVDLTQRYDGGKRFAWWWWLVIAAGVVLVSAVAWRLAAAGDEGAQVEAGPAVPDELTPVTVLGLLDEIRRSGSVPDSERRELDVAALEIERHYFGQSDGSEPDLRAIVHRFVARVRPVS